MGKIREPLKVCLICAITYNDASAGQLVRERLVQSWGEIVLESPVFAFGHTAYYRQEMGTDLFKYFLAFSPLMHPGQLPELKIFTNRLEEEFKIRDQRRVNLDPGYIEAAKLVLATSKNYEHRIYIGQGIYGDVQLRFRKEGIQFNPWTYPDYKEPLTIDFFSQLKIWYMKQLRQN